MELRLHYSPSQQKELDDLLTEFKDIFSQHENNFGEMVNVFHSINTGSEMLIKAQLYCKSYSKEKIISQELQKLQEAKLIQPSNSPWASPLLLIKKKSGGHCIVMDYQKLNSLTKKDSYPLPCINDLLKRLRKAKYFSAMDLASGY